MGTQAEELLAAAIAPPTVAAVIQNERFDVENTSLSNHSKKHQDVADVSIPDSNHEKPDDLENSSDGVFHQYIERGDSEVLISWTKEEEARVVRKADYIFLPTFVV